MPRKGRLEEIFSKALYADDPNLGGDQNVDKETIYLAPDGSVDRVEGEGNPGTTTFRQKVKSGGGGKH